MDYLWTQGKLLGSFASITRIIPEIYFRPPGNNILIFFKGELPTEEEVQKIGTMLKNFGDVTPYDYREYSVIAFCVSSEC